MKHIDAEKLKEHIDKRINILRKEDGYSNHNTICHLDSVKQYIDSLQQEQLEVDLAKELDNWRHNHFYGRRDLIGLDGEYLERSSQLDIARHFYELGLKAGKEESK